MDNSNRSIIRQNDLLGVNKMGKNIKKSPIHQPNFADAARPQSQTHVYNINKNDFRSVVQQLTGSPLQEPPLRPPQNPPKPASNRLQRIKPPPLMPINRPPMPIHPLMPVPATGQPPLIAPGPYHNSNYVQYRQSQPILPTSLNDVWGNTAESPISHYMRYLENSIDSGTKQPQQQSRPQPPPQPQVQPMDQPQHQAPGLLPNPAIPALPSPRMTGPPPLPSPHGNGPLHPLPPQMHGPPPPLPCPRINGHPPLLPSPTTEFFLPPPTGFLNLLSPRSPYPLLSPGYQHPPPLSPFSPMLQSGILGPGPQPPSNRYEFPLSPSGFFPISSPRWRER